MLLPVLYLASYVYLHLVGIIGYNEIDEMLGTRLKLKFTLVEIAYAIHYHLKERLTIVYALRHDNGRIDCTAFLTGYDCLAIALYLSCGYACLQVNGSCRNRTVHINLGLRWHFALKVLAFY